MKIRENFDDSAQVGAVTEARMTRDDLNDWFVMEVLPLEAPLMRYLRRNWRQQEEVADLRQEIYVRLCEAAAIERPAAVKPFVFSTARNLLIDRARREKITPIEAFANIEELETNTDELTPERHAGGRLELGLLQRALEALPARCRQVVSLRRINGLSQREVAREMGITEDTVERQIAIGMRLLAETMLSNGVTLCAPAFRYRNQSRFAKK